MSRFRIVFFGTPEFAVPLLQALMDGPDEVVGVVCQPDRPAGRGQKLQAPPVKQLAESNGIPVVQPVKVRTPEFLAQIQSWSPDVAVVAAYGRILPQSILDAPRHGCLNVHASLLPKYRGAAPIQWAILRGEVETGNSIMQMNAKMDEGDTLLQRATPIDPTETYGQLQSRLAHLGAPVLLEALADLAAGNLRPQPQDHSRATLAPLIRKEDGRIDWNRPAIEIARCVRGFAPWPSAFSTIEGKLVKIHCAIAQEASSSSAPGTIVAIGDSIAVATGQGILSITSLQVEGRKQLPAAEVSRSGIVRIGMRLGEPSSHE